MEKTSDLVLSDYQLAILYQMDITPWQLVKDKVDQQPSQIPEEKPSNQTAVIASKASSKEEALAKLKQLKAQTQSVETTDSVLVTFTENPTQQPLVNDVLITLGVAAKPIKYIATDELSHYSAYPLSWTLGQTISFKDNHLITPALSQLHHPETKKQLWQILQHALTDAKN